MTSDEAKSSQISSWRDCIILAYNCVILSRVIRIGFRGRRYGGMVLFSTVVGSMRHHFSWGRGEYMRYGYSGHNHGGITAFGAKLWQQYGIRRKWDRKLNDQSSKPSKDQNIMRHSIMREKEK